MKSKDWTAFRISYIGSNASNNKHILRMSHGYLSLIEFHFKLISIETLLSNYFFL
jgi:hypothetical protein